MRRRVVRQHQDRRVAVLDELARHAVQEIRLSAPQAMEILVDRVLRHLGPPLFEIGQPVIGAVPVHDAGLFRPVPDGLVENRGGDPVRRPLQQLAGKAAADAVAHEEELADAEMVHQAELVISESVPGVLGRDRAGRLAAIGVALIHRDAAEVVLELFHRIDRSGRPVADPRVQAAAGGHEKREAGADRLVADADIALLIRRHGILSLSVAPASVGGGPDICAVGSSKSREFNPILAFAQARWEGEGERAASLGRYSTPGSGDQRASGPLFGWQAAARSPRGRVPRPAMRQSAPPGLSRSERDGGFAGRPGPP